MAEESKKKSTPASGEKPVPEKNKGSVKKSAENGDRKEESGAVLSPSAEEEIQTKSEGLHRENEPIDSKESEAARERAQGPPAEKIPDKAPKVGTPEDQRSAAPSDSIETKIEESAEGSAETIAEKAQPAGTESEDDRQESIDPLYVKAFTEITPGHNDSNPMWSPSGKLIAYERSIGDKREIIIARADGTVVQKIYCRLSDGDDNMQFFLPGIIDDVSYNAGLSWSPVESSLVFMSNGGSGNYDLYLLPVLGDESTVRLTEHSEKDSHPHWSPVDDRLVFVSGRSGSAEIYLMDLVTREVTRLTQGQKTYLYPQWSPDGKKIVMIYGSNENHDIYLIEDINRPVKTLKALTTWPYDDLRPVWSPDGTKIAFYSNYNPGDNPKLWSIIVINADGSNSTGGEKLTEEIIAVNVVPDIERGPAWMSDSKRIVYVKDDEKSYNPIYVADIEKKTNFSVNTGTKMNHDVVCSSNGLIAFRAQVEQWDHIYIAKLKD